MSRNLLLRSLFPVLFVMPIFSLILGSDNTAIILSLAFFYLLSRHPLNSCKQTRYYDLLYEELHAAIPDAKYLDINMHVLAELPILNGVINEALRLGSPFYLPRLVPPGGANIAGRFVPGGTVVASAAYSQQIDEQNFSPNPLVSTAAQCEKLFLTLHLCCRNSSRKGGVLMNEEARDIRLSNLLSPLFHLARRVFYL